jgi:hypothetical protein
VVIDHARHYSFGAAYYGIYASDLPVLITTDSIAYAVHKTFDDLLMELELSVFLPALDRALTKAHDALVKAGAKDPELYVTVARNLLKGEGAKDWKGQLSVSSRLEQDAAVKALLERAKSLELETPDAPKTPLYGTVRAVDWSQLQPRGHYTKTIELQNYFRAMMWLGRADLGFRLISSPRELAAARALAAAIASTGGNAEVQAISDAIDFFVGESDGLAFLDFAKKSDAEIVQYGQKIRSESIPSDPNDPARARPEVIVNLFGQRFVIDSFVLAEVVYDSILYQGKKAQRTMPVGLDVHAALGDDLALELLAPELEKWGYAANMKALRETIAALPRDFWSATLYNRRLDAMRSLHADLSSERHFPSAMKTRAWRMKQLEAQLGAWAELRHDTILYAKQSYTAFIACEYPKGFVEPYPLFYARVRRFAEDGARLISRVPGAEAVTRRQAAFLEAFAATIAKLETLANKELRALEFTQAENEWLKKTLDQRGGGSGPPRYDGWYPSLFYGGGPRSAEFDPVIADVHTDPNQGDVLEVGVGAASFLMIAVDNEDDRAVYVGPTYSYYEFHQPASDRLTDEAWTMMLAGNKAPARLPFMSAYRGAPKVRELR